MSDKDKSAVMLERWELKRKKWKANPLRPPPKEKKLGAVETRARIAAIQEEIRQKRATQGVKA